VSYFHSSKYISDLANGNICVAVGYSGDVLQAKARAEEAGDKVKIDYSIPKEGAGSFYDMVAIPRDAANVEEAYQFMNFLMRPDIIAEVTNNIGYSNANAAATPLVDEAIRNDPGSYPPEAVMATLYAIPDQPIAVQRIMTRGWTKVKLGK
jgi:putrescine transport system substrate-binding protein